MGGTVYTDPNETELGWIIGTQCQRYHYKSMKSSLRNT